MALLRRKSENPIAALERELSDLTSRRDALDARLATAAGELAQAFDQRRQSLLDSDLSDEIASARRDATCRAAQDRHGSLVDALAAIGAKVADVETVLIAARDHAAREVVARAVTADADALAAAAATFSEAGAKLISAAQAVVARVPTINPQFASELASVVQTIPAAAISELLDAARSHSAQVAAGSAPPRRPVPPPAPEPPAERVERATIFALSPLRWVEGAQTVLAPQYGWASPPKHLAELAVERGLAGPRDSEHVRRVIESFGVASGPGPGEPERAIDLDSLADDRPATEQPAEGQPRTPPMFEERIGQPRQILVDGPRA
jgi:hypothetical protein